MLVPFPAAARPFDTFFPDWTWGRGGIAEGNFEPAEGFWIAPHPPAGVTWTVPSGFNYTPASWSPRAAAWDVSSAVVKVFHGEYWGSWVFELASIDAARGAVVFGRGGFQEARGMATGGALYVEHVRAELDAPGEWYAWANGTIDVFWGAEGVAADVGAPPPPPPPPGALSLAGLETLVDIEGTPTAPAADILFSGITFTGTQPTYLSRPFVAPSGGDWAFGDSAAVYVNGTLRVRFADCTFTALGGNALLLRGWNRNATVERSTFSRVGESAIVTAGRADLGNLSALDVPAGTAIVNCSFSDLGIDVKQAGGVYSALSANTTVAGCVFYSLPRAAININDGAHGGHTIVRNVFAATVLETADHASLNTWDRQPYVQVFEKEEGEKDTSTPRLTHIDQNFFINGGGWGIHPLDHDDGSNAFLDTRNVLFGAGFKNWEGFGRTWHGNLVIRPDYLARASPAPPLPPAATPEGVPLPHFYYFPACVRSLGQASWGARGDVSDGNTCILAQPVANIFGVCNRSQPAASGAVPRAANNSYLVLGGAVDLACGGHMSLAEAQAVGWELGSTVAEAAGLTPDDIVGMIHALLA